MKYTNRIYNQLLYDCGYKSLCIMSLMIIREILDELIVCNNFQVLGGCFGCLKHESVLYQEC